MADISSLCSSEPEDELGDLDSSPTLLNSPGSRDVTCSTNQSILRLQKREEIWSEYEKWCKQSYADSDIKFGKDITRKLSQILFHYNEYVTESTDINVQVCIANLNTCPLFALRIFILLLSILGLHQTVDNRKAIL